jgi:hypothetical protein
MLPSSASTTSNLAVTGVSGTVENRPARQVKLRNTRALVGLVAAVVLFGLAFPGLLAPAVAIAVLAAIVALDLLLPSGELRQMPRGHWTLS